MCKCTWGKQPFTSCNLGAQVEKEREALRFEMNKAAAQMKEADAAIAAQKAELDKLNQIITEADQASTYGPMCTTISTCRPTIMLHIHEDGSKHTWMLVPQHQHMQSIFTICT